MAEGMPVHIDSIFMSKGTALRAMAHKFGYSVLFLSMMPESRGHYKCSFVPICDDAGSMTPHEIMQRYYDLLQADLEKCPSNYLWSHKRWKR